MVSAMMWKPDPAVFDSAARRPPDAPGRVLVWDRFVRLFHWSLAASVATAAATGFLVGATWADVHVVAGTSAVALVAARLVWGVLGSTHARFSDFLVGPRAVISHLRGIAAGASVRHRGHNPLGGWMIVALMLVVAGLAMTGVVVLGGVAKSGPLAYATSFSVGWTVREWHEAAAFVLLGLVALHVAGAVAESLRSRENLVRSMIEGTKVARAVGMGRRINTIMQTCFFYLAKPMPFAAAVASIKRALEKTYGRRGAEAVRRNGAAVDQAVENLRQVPVPDRVTAI
ncbi:MAG: hypothetical protein HC888_19780, partial [Candidatus Competibacteraceae bacterium]|nr:hypothetical protein [Candidatus Competibacteraceae bacterium]